VLFRCCVKGLHDIEPLHRGKDVAGHQHARVVIEVVEDLDTSAVSELPMGEVALPHLVGQVGFEAVRHRLEIGQLRLHRDRPLPVIRDGAAATHRAKMTIDPDTAGMVAAADAQGLNVFDPVPVTDSMAAKIQKTMLWSLDNGRAALAPMMRDPRPPPP